MGLMRYILHRLHPGFRKKLKKCIDLGGDYDHITTQFETGIGYSAVVTGCLGIASLLQAAASGGDDCRLLMATVGTLGLANIISSAWEAIRQ